MAIDPKKHIHRQDHILRDIRPLMTRIGDAIQRQEYCVTFFCVATVLILAFEPVSKYGDILFFTMLLYFWWLCKRDKGLSFKLPMGAPYPDAKNEGPGRSGKAEGILYIGNTYRHGEEVWFTNADARTHILYLGTTGSGKTVGLTSMVTNALTWGSGFVYVDGKADTDLWSNLTSLARRFGRDDDLLVLNYMTGNSNAQAPSNTMNPFSSGSASYLTNMLVELMPEAEGDNAMWKERAVSLCSAMMPVLCYKRDNQDMPMSVITIRDNLSLMNIIKLCRDQTVPEELRTGLKGYLDTLPGYVEDAYDDEGKQKPPGPDTPQYDTTTANQQHGYLAMQFTRALQSLGDDYGYIFDTQAADVDMVDIVLNRRILVVLIPALEKSSDEIANLGKIVAATMKGMMGSTLGSTVEGTSAKVIENKPTHSATPFMTVFDEVGYYTASGMAVMAAQARSLGFSLVFSGQDLPAMKKRVREEANSITANCNIKIFGKLEDPTETKEFFEKTVGTEYVTEVATFQISGGSELGSYVDNQQASVQTRARASYEELRSFKEGNALIAFETEVERCQIFYSNPGKAKAMRVTRYMALPPPDDELVKNTDAITELRDLLVSKTWTAAKADVAVDTPPEIEALEEGYRIAERAKEDPVMSGITAIVGVHAIENPVEDLPPTEAKTPAEPSKINPDEVLRDIDQAKKEVQTPEKQEEKKPFSMFGSKSDAEDDTKQQTAQTPAEKQDTPKQEEPAEPAAKKPTTKPKKLPPEIENIIKDAAEDAGRNLFGKSDIEDGS